MFHTYILRCADGTLYVGFTDDLDQRVARHNAGRGAAYTAARVPVRLVYSESFDNSDAARAREAQLKRWSCVKKEALVAGDFATVHECARRRGS